MNELIKIPDTITTKVEITTESIINLSVGLICVILFGGIVYVIAKKITK